MSDANPSAPSTTTPPEPDAASTEDPSTEDPERTTDVLPADEGVEAELGDDPGAGAD
jgi:hypothetical protein